MSSTLAPVPQERIQTAVQHGINPGTAEALAKAARDADVPFYMACALMMKESGGGRNIFGHDIGGALSTSGGAVTVAGKRYERGQDIPVNALTAGVFLLKIGAGAKSNGMGPCQITYAAELPDGRSGGYFRQMLDDQGLVPWDAHDNMLFGLRILHGNYARTESWVQAGAHYNGGTKPGARAQAYGRDLAARGSQFRRWFGLG